jgi:XTP/dITP diphosphohydrolase
MKRLVLATANPGKLREMRALFAALGCEVVAQATLGVAEAAEPFDSFVENALEKARHASRASGLPALADDSGLCVDALGGAPGVNSAYYAGRDGSRAERDARNNAKLLASLGAQRSARYCCVMALVRSADDAQPLIAEGEWRGEIARAPRGANGFGYDPLFLVAGDGRTPAGLPEDEKNRHSHRGQAARRRLELLR